MGALGWFECKGCGEIEEPKQQNAFLCGWALSSSFVSLLVIASLLFTRFYLFYYKHMVHASIILLPTDRRRAHLCYYPLQFIHGSAYWCVALPVPPPSPPRPTSSWKTLQMLVLLMKSLSMMATRKYESWMAWISALEADSSS